MPQREQYVAEQAYKYFYRAQSLSAAVGAYDIGTLAEVFERAGLPLPPTGRRRTEFVDAAEGRIVLRIGWTFYAVPPQELQADVNDLVARLTEQEVPQ